jgi:hypothetical protein
VTGDSLGTLPIIVCHELYIHAKRTPPHLDLDSLPSKHADRVAGERHIIDSKQETNSAYYFVIMYVYISIWTKDRKQESYTTPLAFPLA